MPNWTKNEVRVSGPKEAVAEFKAFVATRPGSEEPSCFDVEAFMPTPEALLNDSGKDKRQRVVFERLYGAGDWYDWRCRHWGSKWGACDPDLVADDENFLVYHFRTAWCGLDGVAETLREAFPELKITWECLDEGDVQYTPELDQDGKPALDEYGEPLLGDPLDWAQQPTYSI